jgi:uncharacterized protein YvpB
MPDAMLYTGTHIFTDTENRWSEEYIEFLAGQGIIHGYGDGSFLPSASLTREEFASMALEYLERRSAYSLDAADAAGADGVATPGGIAVPGLDVPGIDSAAVPASDAPAAAVFWDIAESYAANAIERLCADGVLSGYPDGSFRPKDLITRAEIATVIHRLSGLEGVYPQQTLPEALVTDAPYISQLYPVNAPVGCEATSLLMALHAKGYAQDVDLRRFLDALPRHPEDPAKGFVGSPYVPDLAKKTRTTIDPPKLAEYGGIYGKVTDVSGSSVHELRTEILAGNLVVVYATLWWEKPYYRDYIIEGASRSILSNNHAVLVNGYDRRTNAYYITDPYNKADTGNEYRYWIDAQILDPIYNERKFALLIE